MQRTPYSPLVPITVAPPPASQFESETPAPVQTQDEHTVIAITDRKYYSEDSTILLWKTKWSSGEYTWEPKESFIDEDGTENDIYKDYNAAHPIKTNRKRKEPSSEMMETQKKKKHKPVPRLSKTARNTQ